MGVMHQLANASLAAIFAIGMIVAAQRFIEYRSARAFELAPITTVALTPP
ncbi:hypothetical protein [Bradyrhizobium sp. STM 3843]|nr:hypothetical protein [Bradyrhizobium sp. STM 3843]